LSGAEFKKLILNALKESVAELRKGNPRGYGIIDNTLDSLATIYDDEEILFMDATVGSVNLSFIEKQCDLEGGDKFLKGIADILEDIMKKYESDASTELDKLYRKLYVYLRGRWKESAHLAKKERR